MLFSFIRRWSGRDITRRSSGFDTPGLEDFRETFAAEVAAMDELSARPLEEQQTSRTPLLLRQMDAVRSRTMSRSRRSSSR